MKKLLLAIAMMLLTIGASAQISNVKTQDAIKTISKFRAGVCSLNQHGDVFYLILKSTNKFDDSVIVYLGEGKDSAVQTLKDLQELHKSMEKGDFADFTINVMKKEIKYSVSKFDKFNFSFLDQGTAGSVFFATTEMKTLISKLSDE